MSQCFSPDPLDRAPATSLQQTAGVKEVDTHLTLTKRSQLGGHTRLELPWTIGRD
ncbi:hypothetical protein ACOMHN_064487, partial [Nucella lapillus]